MATESKGNCVLLNDLEWKYFQERDLRGSLRARWEIYRRWGQVFRGKRQHLGEINLFQLVDDLTELLLQPEQNLHISKLSERLGVDKDWLAKLIARMLLEKNDLGSAP